MTIATGCSWCDRQARLSLLLACLVCACSADGDSLAGRGLTRGSHGVSSSSKGDTSKSPGFTGSDSPPADTAPPVLPDMPVMGASCGSNCTQIEFGAGTGQPFDLTTHPHERVQLDADGALVTEPENPAEREAFIWIADTGANPPTVAKVNTRTRLTVARYIVGAPDPSRTSVSLTGDAYVGSRGGRGVTKISGLGADCPDTNGDGVVTTSTGPNDVLPFGQDDCMLWFVSFTNPVRGVAAQDIPGTTVVESAPDAPPKVTTTPDQHFVWIGEAVPGNNATAMAHKLDGDTGAILLSTPMPRGAYGFALDGTGMLWLTGGAYWGGSLAFIDTRQCVDTATCNVMPCTVTCSETACPATCDGAVKGDITLMPNSAYGITVDCKQRVWLGGYAGPMKRYDQSAPADQRLLVGPADTNGVHGIAADAAGFVWGGALGRGVVRVDAETMAQTAIVAQAGGAKGMAIDADGQVWAVTRGATAHMIQPGPTVTDNTVLADAVDGLKNPYTYSDMTGQQLELAANRDPGIYRQLVEGCAGSKATMWMAVDWDAETPGKSWIVFQVRTADTLDELEKADWIALAGATPAFDPGSASIEDELARHGLASGKYVELRIELNNSPGSASKCGGTDPISPRVKNLSVNFTCPPDTPG